MKKQFHYLLASILMLGFNASAQYSITGNFPKLAGQTVRLIGFEGFGTNPIDSTRVSTDGKFLLKYASGHRGMAYLSAADKKPYFVVLANENIALKGEALSNAASVSCLAGNENQQFIAYAVEQPKREQALSAWDYLRNMYFNDSLFAQQYQTKQMIDAEINRIKKADSDYLTGLDPKSYVAWYLPTRRLVGSVGTVVQYRTHEIKATLDAFRKLDYTDIRLYKSGLYADVINSHYWLIENMGQPMDSVFTEMKISIDYLLLNLEGNDEKFNEITSYLFELLEKHSLFEASEYLAIKSLTQNSCTLNNDFAKQLETYRAMKIGNTAPDINFAGTTLKNGLPLASPKKLSEIQKAFTVVIFGASWCPRCQEELAQIPSLYPKWSTKNIEVVFVSLDTDTAQFKNFTKPFAFVSTCNFKKWETQSAKDYYVFATPTMFILDSNRKILLRPNSVKQIDAWVDYNKGKGRN